MKRILIILISCFAVLSPLSAEVLITGQAYTGYRFKYDDNDNRWEVKRYGRKKTKAEGNSTRIYLQAVDEMGIYSLDFKEIAYYGEKGQATANLTMDITKAIENRYDIFPPFTFTLSLGNTNQVEGLRAYFDSFDNDYDRLETMSPNAGEAADSWGDGNIAEKGAFVTAYLQYEKIEVQAATDPVYSNDFSLSMRLTPRKGFKIATTYAFKGDYTHNGAIGVSARLDVDKVFKNGLDLLVGGYCNFGFKDDGDISDALYYGAGFEYTRNEFLYLGEYRFVRDSDEEDGRHQAELEIDYSYWDFVYGANFKINDFADAGREYAVEGSLKYDLDPLGFKVTVGFERSYSDENSVYVIPYAFVSF